MKHVKSALVILLFLLSATAILLFAQGTGTITQLRGLTDANNSLLVAASAQSGTISQPTVLSNLRLRTDSNNNLLVVPFLTAGGGTQQYKPEGTLFWENPAVSTTAGNTTFVNGTTYILPAGTASTNGDRIDLDVTVLIPTAAATDNKNLNCNIGFSAFTASTGVYTGGINIVANSSASSQGQVMWHVLAEVVRLSATSTGFRWYNWWESGVSATTTTQSAGYTTSATNTWANGMNILCAVGNTTGGNTQVLTLQEWRIDWHPR